MRRSIRLSIRPTRAILQGVRMLDFYCGLAQGGRDGVEECIEILGHCKRLLQYKTLISPGPHGACNGYGTILAGVQSPMVGCSAATPRAHASGRDHRA
jgi:hypothetical protein